MLTRNKLDERAVHRRAFPGQQIHYLNRILYIHLLVIYKKCVFNIISWETNECQNILNYLTNFDKFTDECC